MQAIAREMNFSETAFVVEERPGEASVRIFTTNRELPFAGHPTLGTAWVLGRDRDLVRARSSRRACAGDLRRRHRLDAASARGDGRRGRPVPDRRAARPGRVGRGRSLPLPLCDGGAKIPCWPVCVRSMPCVGRSSMRRSTKTSRQEAGSACSSSAAPRSGVCGASPRPSPGASPIRRPPRWGRVRPAPPAPVRGRHRALRRGRDREARAPRTPPYAPSTSALSSAPRGDTRARRRSPRRGARPRSGDRSARAPTPRSRQPKPSPRRCSGAASPATRSRRAPSRSSPNTSPSSRASTRRQAWMYSRLASVRPRPNSGTPVQPPPNMANP